MTLTLTDVGTLKNFQKNRTERRKARRIFGDVRVYLLVDELVTIMYIHMKTPRVSNSTGMYRVLLSSTKSTTLTLTDVGSLKNFQKWNRAP